MGKISEVAAYYCTCICKYVDMYIRQYVATPVQPNAGEAVYMYRRKCIQTWVNKYLYRSGRTNSSTVMRPYRHTVVCCSIHSCARINGCTYHRTIITVYIAWYGITNTHTQLSTSIWKHSTTHYL